MGQVTALNTTGLQNASAATKALMEAHDAWWDVQFASTDETKLASLIADVDTAIAAGHTAILTKPASSSNREIAHNPDFRKLYKTLAPDIRRRARQAYKVWRQNPAHPGCSSRSQPNQPVYAVRTAWITAPGSIAWRYNCLVLDRGPPSLRPNPWQTLAINGTLSTRKFRQTTVPQHTQHVAGSNSPLS